MFNAAPCRHSFILKRHKPKLLEFPWDTIFALGNYNWTSIIHCTITWEHHLDIEQWFGDIQPIGAHLALLLLFQTPQARLHALHLCTQTGKGESEGSTEYLFPSWDGEMRSEQQGGGAAAAFTCSASIIRPRIMASWKRAAHACDKTPGTIQDVHYASWKIDEPFVSMQEHVHKASPDWIH